MVNAYEFTETNKRNEHTVSKGQWVLYQIDEGIQFRHKDGANFLLSPELVERIWEYLDHGEQPTRWDETWNVSADDWSGGLDFRKHIGSGGSYWGITASGLSALIEWRDTVRPRTKSEQIVIDLNNLKNRLQEDYPDHSEYVQLINDAVQNIEDRIKNFN